MHAFQLILGWMQAMIVLGVICLLDDSGLFSFFMSVSCVML
jgi:hypothetical protein